MKDNFHNLKRNAIKAKIRNCDPFVAKTLADYYEGLLDKGYNDLSVVEQGVKASIEKFCTDSDTVEKRELNGVIDAVNAILAKKDTDHWSAHESAFLNKLESIVFLKLNGTDKVSELDQIDKYVESLLKLDYPKNLPTFQLANNKRNIFNYFSLSLESISEKIKESTISAKAVNNMMQYLPDTVMIVSDNEWNIRFVGEGESSFFDRDPTLMIDQCLVDYIIDFESVTKELEQATCVTQMPVKIQTNLHSKAQANVLVSIIPNQIANYHNGEQDEIEEYVIKLDLQPTNETSRLSLEGEINASNELISTVRQNLSNFKGDINSEEWNILNNCLEQLLEVKTKKENLLVDNNANYSGGTFSRKEIIDVNSMVKKIASDLETFPGFDEVIIVLENKKVSPFIGYYDMIYSVLRHLITVAVKFRKSDNTLNEITISTLGLEKDSCIRIRDNGLGMPESWLATIFDENFFKADNVNEKKLINGLYHVKKTVERMNGKVELLSSPNEGSTFTIHLPQ